MLGAGDGNFIVKLRGLPFSTTADDVLEFLDGVNIVNDKEGIHLTEVRTGRPSGECFVEVVSQDDVDEALKKDKEHMGKRYIEVFSTDRQDMEWALNAMNQTDRGSDSLPHVPMGMGVVKLRGLPFGCTKDDIVKFFEGLPLRVEDVHILLDSTGRASGEAFVYFEDVDSAQEALNKDREKIGHRYIEVFMSSAEEVDQWRSRDDWGGSRGSSYQRGYRVAPYDRNERPNRFGARGRGPPMRGGGFGGRGGGLGGGSGFRPRGGGGGCTVFMRGLPFKATQQDIAYFFKPIRPMNINILFDDSGRPSGEAEVEFECHDDAMRAMRRDKNNIDNRYIELFMNSSPGGGGGGGLGGGGFGRSFRNNY